jgi:hypothetical protein
VTKSSKAALPDIQLPARILVLTSKDCPNCPNVVREVHRLEEHSPQIIAEVHDVTDAEPLREQFNVTAVPATILDDDLVIQGQVTAERLAQILNSRNTPHFSTEKLRVLLDASRVDDAADFIRAGDNVQGILPLLVKGDLSTRMGVILTLQRAHEKQPGSLSRFVPELIELLSHEEAPLRGDVADLLGTVGDERAIEPLEKLLEDADEDVAEAAADSLDLLRGHNVT